MHDACSIIHFGHLFHLLCKINIFAVKLSGSDLIFDLYSIELFLKLEIQHSDNFAGTFLHYQFFIFLVQAILDDPRDFSFVPQIVDC